MRSCEVVGGCDCFNPIKRFRPVAPLREFLSLISTLIRSLNHTRPIMTKRKMNKSRRLTVQSLECRRVLAASMGWDGPGQGSAELTYYIANHPSSLDQAETDAAIRAAFDAWAEVIDVSFTQVDTPGLRESIDISFTEIDGTAGALAQAYFPDDVNPARIAGDIEFDIAEAWEVGNQLGSQAFDLVWVAAHEIGHSLGLEHTEEPGAVLAPFLTPTQEFVGLTVTDIAAALEIYAPADTTVSASDDDTTRLPNAERADEFDPASDEEPDSENDPFPRRRWRRGGGWQRWGGRLNLQLMEHNYRQPTDVNGDQTTSPSDALMIINQLAQSANTVDSNAVSHGLCDANGDGEVTPSDALMVINTLDGGSSEIELVNEEAGAQSEGEQDPVDVVDGESTDEQTEIDSEESVDPTDGGVVNEETDLGEDDTEYTKRQTRILLKLNVEDVITDFDTNGDAFVDQDELPAKLWNVLTAAGADADGDLLLSADEITTVVSTVRQESFDSKDSNGDGLLEEDEVGTLQWMRLAAADADADVAVSFAEFQAWLDSGDAFARRHRDRAGRRTGQARLLQTNAVDLLEKFDASGDGQLDQGELPERLWEKLTELQVDANGDSLLTPAELSSAITAIREEKFDSKDTDGNGQLVAAEVGERIWEKISVADVDNDQAVTFTEFAEWLDSGEADLGGGHKRGHYDRGEADGQVDAMLDMVFANLGRRIRFS